MKKNLKRVSIITLLVVMCLASILSVSAATITRGLTNGQSFSLEEKNITNPRTVIKTRASSASTIVSTKLEKKGTIFWSNVGTLIEEVYSDDYKVYDWKVSGTNNVRATWKDEKNEIGYGIAGDFELKSK